MKTDNKDTEESYFEEEEDPELRANALREVEPECSEDPDVIEDMGVECEFNFKNGVWWCTTHNCHA